MHIEISGRSDSDAPVMVLSAGLGGLAASGCRRYRRCNSVTGW